MPDIRELLAELGLELYGLTITEYFPPPVLHGKLYGPNPIAAGPKSKHCLTDHLSAMGEKGAQGSR